MDQANQIMDAARSFGPESFQGQIDKSRAEMESQVEIGKAFGNIVGLIDQAAAQHIKDLTKYLIDNKEPIGQALAAIVGFGMGLADVSAQVLVGLGKLVEWLDSFFGTGVETDPVMAEYNGPSIGGSDAQMLIYHMLQRKLGGE